MTSVECHAPMGAHSMVAAGVEVCWTGEGDGRVWTTVVLGQKLDHCSTVAGLELKMHSYDGMRKTELET